MNTKSTILTASMGLMLVATVAATSATAADRMSILDNAIFDYTDRGPSSVNSSGGENRIKIVLDESEYDYTPRHIEQNLEEADFAAFEVVDEPDDLKVWD